MTNGHGKSDSSAVPAKLPNQAEGPAAEVTEGRGLAKGCLRQRAPDAGPESTLSALERVRQPQARIETAVLRSCTHLDASAADSVLIKKAQPRASTGRRGALRKDLEANLQDLSIGSSRAYRQLVRRVSRGGQPVSFAHSGSR